MKHTPGSWEVHGHVFSQNGEKQIVVGQKGGWAVATVRRSPNYGGILEDNEDLEQNDNARLISLVPELYEALRQIVWKVNRTQGYVEMREDVVMHMAKRVLAKVEGEEAGL